MVRIQSLVLAGVLLQVPGMARAEALTPAVMPHARTFVGTWCSQMFYDRNVGRYVHLSIDNVSPKGDITGRYRWSRDGTAGDTDPIAPTTRSTGSVQGRTLDVIVWGGVITIKAEWRDNAFRGTLWYAYPNNGPKGELPNLILSKC